MKKTICIMIIIAVLTTCCACAIKTGTAKNPEPVGTNFDPEAGKKYVAYLYVVHATADGFVGGGDLSGETYVIYDGADEKFGLFSTVRVVFDGADYIVETRTTEDYVTKQTISKVTEARLASYENNEPIYDKPIIYLYPEKETTCSVKLDLRGEITCAYPAYGDGGWQNFTASPDGTLTFPDGRQYYALYWEGNGAVDAAFDMSKGFCVKGEDTAKFLAEILPRLGLSAKEANEFIIYWLPRMQDNAYNLISFQGEAYKEVAKLTIDPAPDTLIRVFMVFRPLPAAITVEPQLITTPERTGFTVVEWGGSEIR